MRFGHSPAIWRTFPQLAAGTLVMRGITATADVETDKFFSKAGARLGGGSPSELAEIQAWRRAFAAMGLKPTQYRCAAESLLRRFAKEGSLPSIHPLIDLCNAVSLAWAIPVAVFDIERVEHWLEVRHADGTETYETFGGDVEHPAPNEVIFADGGGNAHARRWSNRQSGRSAVQARTTDVLIVAEALHDTAAADVESLVMTLSEQLASTWSPPTHAAMLSAADPCTEFQA